MRLVFDIETDGLLLECTRLWIVVAIDVDTKTKYVFEPGDMDWQPLFDSASALIGHNIMGFDIPALQKLTGYVPPARVKLQDTLIMSQVMDYQRFGVNEGHSLARWGEHLGIPKQAHEDWTAYSPEMRSRCITDTELTLSVFSILAEEFAYRSEHAPFLGKYIRCEHYASAWCAKSRLKGWPFDSEEALSISHSLEVEMQKAYDALNSRLGTKCVAVDKKNGEVLPKMPKWTKRGCYDQHTANWFNINPWSGLDGEERPVVGAYSRITFEPLSLDSVADVKIFLFRNGWVPTEWNYKDIPGSREKEKTTPKITEDSLEFLGGDGKLYVDFLTAKSRFSIIKTWLNNVDSSGNLHGDCHVIGTPSMRARHEIIVNVPAGDSAWGPEMRKLFKSLPGWALIGCDSSGNQARGLAHYLGDATFIDTLLNGDIHQYNADILTAIVREILNSPELVVKRGQAKRILYAFLFGASGGKLWSYIFGSIDTENGNKLKNRFVSAVPGFKELLDKLNKIFSATSRKGLGYIPSIAGNRVYVNSRHKLLVYLLQACEKVTCSAALMLTSQRLEEAGIPYIPCIFYHDEIDFMVPDEHKERAAEIGKQAFADGPKMFGIEIMSGDAKIGYNWYDVH